jgi:phage terminase large subunit-like protein
MSSLDVNLTTRERLPPDFKLKPKRERFDEHIKYAHETYSKYKQTQGDLVIEFCNSLRVPSGRDTGKMVVLRDWQCNIVKRIYDPLDDITGLRKIREACLTMARKNGKTSLAAMLVLTHLVGPMVQRNGELYSAGFRRDQSAIIWRALYQMISVDDQLSALCTYSRTHKTVDCGQFGTTYKAISAEAKSKHGFNPVFVIIDELSQFQGDRTLYDVFKTSVGAQDESLLLTISTQAASDAAIMSETIDYGRQVNAGEIDDDSFVLFEYSTDDFDDILDEEIWKKANPALGDFRSIVEMRQTAERAKVSPSAEQTFRNLYLNQRVDSTVSLVSPSTWRANGERPQNIVMGRKAYLALDLSEKLDMTCLMVILPDDSGKLDVIPIYFTPEDTIEERTKRDRVNYYDWWKRGYIIACPGKSVDYRFVARHTINMIEDFDVQFIVFDRWRINNFWACMQLEDFDPQTVQWVPHGQGYKDMTPAIETTEEYLLNARIRHGMNPVLTFNAGSTKVSKDPAGNRKFDKVRSQGKIDGMVCLAMGINVYHTNTEGKEISVYEKRAPITVPLNTGRVNLTQLEGPKSVWDVLDAA